MNIFEEVAKSEVRKDQPRDERGRFGSGGTAGESTDKAAAGLLRGAARALIPYGDGSGGTKSMTEAERQGAAQLHLTTHAMATGQLHSDAHLAAQAHLAGAAGTGGTPAEQLQTAADRAQTPRRL